MPTLQGIFDWVKGQATILYYIFIILRLEESSGEKLGLADCGLSWVWLCLVTS
jgi:hypothetical protein